jgi:hypothetical protein
MRREPNDRRVIMIAALFTSLPVASAIDVNLAAAMPNFELKQIDDWLHQLHGNKGEKINSLTLLS